MATNETLLDRVSRLGDAALEWKERAREAEAVIDRITAERDGLRTALEAERERCAKVADQEAADAEQQIERNNEYLSSKGFSLNSSSNELCRSRLFAARRVADAIRSLPALATSSDTDADGGGHG